MEQQRTYYYYNQFWILLDLNFFRTQPFRTVTQYRTAVPQLQHICAFARNRLERTAMTAYQPPRLIFLFLRMWFMVHELRRWQLTSDSVRNTTVFMTNESSISNSTFLLCPELPTFLFKPGVTVYSVTCKILWPDLEFHIGTLVTHVAILQPVICIMAIPHQSKVIVAGSVCLWVIPQLLSMFDRLIRFFPLPSPQRHGRLQIPPHNFN